MGILSKRSLRLLHSLVGWVIEHPFKPTLPPLPPRIKRVPTPIPKVCQRTLGGTQNKAEHTDQDWISMFITKSVQEKQRLHTYVRLKWSIKSLPPLVPENIQRKLLSMTSNIHAIYSVICIYIKKKKSSFDHKFYRNVILTSQLSR